MGIKNDEKLTKTIDPSARFEHHSIMSKQDRTEALRSFYDTKRTMSVPANAWVKGQKATPVTSKVVVTAS